MTSAHNYDSFITWGKKQDMVRAMLLTGSLAGPAANIDVLSDYDIILVLTDIHPFFENHDWLADFGTVLAAFYDPLLVEDGLEASGNVVQYENGLKIDFTLWTVEHLKHITAATALPEEFDAGYHILLDKDHLTEGLKPPTYRGYIPQPPTSAKYQEIMELFFLDACYVAKFLWRDDVVAAKHLLDYFIKQDYLIPMLVWRSEIDHNWSVKPGNFGRRLKRWLRPDLWAELETTYTGAGIAENWQALENTIALMRRVAIETGEKLGYAYPHALHARTMAYLEKVKRLDKNAERFPG
jgi:aminoglycoside 6-adenylyltransferase